MFTGNSFHCCGAAVPNDDLSDNTPKDTNATNELSRT